MTNPLYVEVLDRLVGDLEHLGDVADLIDAAMRGDAALDEAAAAARVWTRPAGVATATPVHGIWLQQLEVEGFRGIGPRVRVDFEPRPGLVLVCGRNGTGKSSLAEGFEVLLTGRNARLAEKTADWKGGWRNLSHGHAHVTASFSATQLGAFEVTRRWKPEAVTLEDAEESASAGRKALDLDWAGTVESYRPLLGTQELARMHDRGPAATYDALKGILGLDELTSAAERLGARRRRAKERADGGKSPKDLVTRLGGVDDPRAAPIAALLAKRSPDLDAIERSLAGADVEEATGLPALRRAAAEVPPELAVGTAAVAALRSALDAREAAARTAEERARRVVVLLDAAVSWHDGHTPADCPVCGTAGAIDAGWGARVRALRASLDEAARVADAVARAVGDAERVARDFAEDRSLAGHRLADHVEATLPARVHGAAARREAAVRELERRERGWAPAVTEVRAWLVGARQAASAKIEEKRFETGEKWLRAQEEALRSARFAPIAAKTQEIWANLRQESSVELAEVRLAGTAKQRKVDLRVTIEGHDNVALGVMSQGELNALALALFLPRATLGASPFRFVVIDDPVQAMDPGKIDGLARTLADYAKERQVVVFTHDPRLAEAVRRLQLPAQVLEVTRRRGSVVEVRAVSDAVSQALRDAREVLRSNGLGDKLQRAVVPGFCRAAVEAACHARVRARRLGRGDPPETVEAALGSAHRLVQKLALSLFDDAERGGDVHGELPPNGYAMVKALNAGAHGHFEGDLHDLVDGAEAVARHVRRHA